MKKIILFYLLFSTISASAKVNKIRLIINSKNKYIIAWNQISGKSPILIYDTKKYFNKNHRLCRAIKPQKSNKYYKMHTFFAEITNLKPNTTYFITIKDSEGESNLLWFHTLPPSSEKLSIIAGGDSRTNPNIRQKADKMVGKLQPDFVIFDGDFTSLSTASEWKQWLDDWTLTTQNNRLIPIIVAQGNHERNNALQKLFDTPQNSFYSVQFNKILHISILNSQYNPDIQKSWLANDLKNSNAKWKFVVYHKAMRPHYSKKHNQNEIYNAWANTIYKYNVDIVLEGDTHVNKITYPIKPSSKPGNDNGFVKDSTGTIYLGEGTWGAPLRPYDNPKSWTMDGASINQFKLIFVSNKKIQIRTIVYQNADSINQNTYKNRFNLPKNLKIWKPKGQNCVTIYK
jgi:predicted phosphodiesterase